MLTHLWTNLWTTPLRGRSRVTRPVARTVAAARNPRNDGLTRGRGSLSTVSSQCGHRHAVRFTSRSPDRGHDGVVHSCGQACGRQHTPHRRRPGCARVTDDTRVTRCWPSPCSVDDPWRTTDVLQKTCGSPGGRLHPSTTPSRCPQVTSTAPPQVLSAGCRGRTTFSTESTPANPPTIPLTIDSAAPRTGAPAAPRSQHERHDLEDVEPVPSTAGRVSNHKSGRLVSPYRSAVRHDRGRRRAHSPTS